MGLLRKLVINRFFENGVISSKVLVFIGSITFSNPTIARNNENTRDLSLGISTYFYNNWNGFNSTRFVIGPMVKLNADRKFQLKLGVLYEPKKYVYFEKVVNYSTGTISYLPTYRNNIFFPLLIQYNFFQKERFNFNVYTGCMFGGRNFIDKNEHASELSKLNIVLGLGFSYKILDWLLLEPSLSFRHNQEKLFPGFSFDLLVILNNRN